MCEIGEKPLTTLRCRYQFKKNICHRCPAN